MTTSVPVFVPAGESPVAGIVELPKDITRPPVVLLPGGDNPRIRNPIMRDAGRHAAAVGAPVLRMDYPGCGLSPGPRSSSEAVFDAVERAGKWFAQLCGATEITIGGVCRGARVAIVVASRSELVGRVVAVSYPFGGAATKSAGRRVKEGLAAVAPVANRTLPRLTRRSKEASLNAGEQAVEDLVAAVGKSSVTLVYGDEDPGYEQLAVATSRGLISEATMSSLELIVRPGTQLYLYKSQEDSRWLTETVANLLSQPAANA